MSTYLILSPFVGLALGVVLGIFDSVFRWPWWLAYMLMFVLAVAWGVGYYSLIGA